MLRLIPVEDLTRGNIYKLVNKLQRKTNMFDYVDVDIFCSDVLTKQYIIWTDHCITVLGKVNKYPTGLTAISLTVVNLTDDKAIDLQASLNQIEQEAKAVGINRIILDGRYGWKKVFPDYSLSSVILTKEI